MVVLRGVTEEHPWMGCAQGDTDGTKKPSTYPNVPAAVRPRSVLALCTSQLASPLGDAHWHPPPQTQPLLQEGRCNTCD